MLGDRVGLLGVGGQLLVRGRGCGGVEGVKGEGGRRRGMCVLEGGY